MVNKRRFTDNLPDYQHILIIQTAFIGDAILASSLVEKLHAQLPRAEISILVRKGNESIYAHHPFLKEVLIWNKKEQKMKNLFKLLLRIRANKYDLVVNCHRYTSSGFLTAFSGARHTTGFKQNPLSFMFNTTAHHRIGDGTHETQRYNQLVEDFLDKTVFKPKLYPGPADLEKIKSYQKGNYICMAPASVWFTKQLPKEKWLELIQKTDTKTTIYLLGAPGDKDLCSEIKRQSGHPDVHVLCGELSLLQSCALMQGANMNYVNDSAPLHLASSVNAPVTAFFCSTVPEFGFGPLSNQQTVLQVQGLACKPCGLHGYRKCPQGHFKCGHDMLV